MKLTFFLIITFIINNSISILVFPFKARENDAKTYASPINKEKIPILEYLYHILNDREFVSEVDVGNPRQKVEVLFNFDDNFLTLLGHTTSQNPYYYNLSSTYKELYLNDKNLTLKVANSATIKEILHMKNKFYANLNDFIASKDEIDHEFIIIFDKHLPTLKQIVTYKFHDSNAVNIGMSWNTKYNKNHGIYEPFFNEVKNKGYIENYLHFIYFFDEYEENLYYIDKNPVYDGLFVLGKYPHEVLPDKYDIKNLYWTNTFLKHHRFVDDEDISWGIKFNEVYIDYGNNKKEKFEFLRGVFDLDVEYIFPPYLYYETIKNFFRPLRKICFIDSNARLFKDDPNIYRMVYCDYEEFGKKYLKTFPKLVFRIDDFNETFEFTYKDLFKPIYDNKYYLFLIFTGRFWRASELVIQPPSYPWTLGRIFFKKYQFVFDSLNKKVGYYKRTNIKKTNIEEDTTINIIDSIKENNVINTQKEDDNKPIKKSIKEENEKTEKKENNVKENSRMNNKKEIKEIQKDNNIIIDSMFIIIFGIALSIILAVIIAICYECISRKKQRKKRVNELIDETEYIPKEEQKV